MAKNRYSLPIWDLTEIYQGLNDPQIDADHKQLITKADRFAKRYRGKITSEITPGEMLQILKEYERIMQKATLMLEYAFLNRSVDENDPKKGAFWQKMLQRYMDINNILVFFTVKVSELDDKKIRQLAADRILKNYAHFLQIQLAWKPHRLKENEEKILNDKYLTSSAAFTRLFENKHAKKKYLFAGKELTESQVLEKMYSSDRKTREEAATAITQGLSEDTDLMAYTYNVIAQDKSIDDKYRHFKSMEASRHLSNEISQSTVDTLVSVVQQAYPLVHEYYVFKKELLGYRTLFDYDRYAAIFPSRTKIPYEQAKQIVLESFEKFSPRFAAEAQRFFDEGWIDAQPRDGKENGAYCTYVTPDHHPYVLLNYHGNLRDVLTLAHELGHGVNGTLARKQTFLNFDWPLTIAETASIFGEFLIFNNLKDRLANKKDKITLYCGMIEETIATVFRQITMFQFERDVHSARAQKGELTAAEISRFWRKRQQAMFGRSVKLTAGHDIWWSYIPHFIRTPFYVYAYAFGNLLTLSLYAKYKKENDKFVDQYLSLLSAGGCQTPAELLFPLGVDLDKREFWQGGIGIIASMIKEVKGMYAETAKKRR